VSDVVIEPSAADAIRDAARVDLFLRDDAIVMAFALMERRYYEEFKQADSSESRVRAWAKANVLDDFQAQLRIVVTNGEAAVFGLQADAKRKMQRPT
jgi:hypothetical protein